MFPVVPLRRMRRAGITRWQIMRLLNVRLLWQRGWFTIDSADLQPLAIFDPWERMRLKRLRQQWNERSDNGATSR